jgi:hypothetical protein
VSQKVVSDEKPSSPVMPTPRQPQAIIVMSMFSNIVYKIETRYSYPQGTIGSFPKPSREQVEPDRRALKAKSANLPSFKSTKAPNIRSTKALYDIPRLGVAKDSFEFERSKKYRPASAPFQKPKYISSHGYPL